MTVGWRAELSMPSNKLNVKKSVIEKSKRLLVARLFSTSDIRLTDNFLVWRREDGKYVLSALGIINGVRGLLNKPYIQIRLDKEGKE